MHKCNIFLYFPRNQPTKIMQVSRPADHDNTTLELAADIMDGLSYVRQSDDDFRVTECSEDSAPLITVNGRRFKVQFLEII